MIILITGARGFVGRNLVQTLRRRDDMEIIEYDIGFPEQQLVDGINKSDLIFHLAGVSRPSNPDDYEASNVGFTEEICSRLANAGRAPTIVFASSIQAELDNPYGRSKLHAEECLRQFSDTSGARVMVFRWTNLFGKWCRPNYNSVTATFCYNVARGLPFQVSDPSREIELVYVDDVVASLMAELDDNKSREQVVLARVKPTYRVTLGNLATTIQSLHDSRTNLTLPDMSNKFIRCLYATYLSYLPENEFAYPLEIKRDNRGELAEFLKSPTFGQIFVSRTNPGITRGNHYHHTKVEKFLVVEGDAVIRLRHIESNEVISYHVSGNEFRVIDIPPGYTHLIENVGTSEMVTLFWADEIFDPANSETYFMKVLHE